jgi:hypothetical protein
VTTPPLLQTTPPASAPEDEASRVNPSVAALLTAAGFAWVLAYMLWVVLVDITDYEGYDRHAAAALIGWIDILIVGGVVALVGAVVLWGVRWELRRRP